MDKAHNSNTKRHFSRIAMDSTVKLLSDSTPQESELIDISLKGALITQPENWTGKIGDTCRIEVLLESAEIMIEMEGSIDCSCRKRTPRLPLLNILILKASLT